MDLLLRMRSILVIVDLAFTDEPQKSLDPVIGRSMPNSISPEPFIDI